MPNCRTSPSSTTAGTKPRPAGPGCQNWRCQPPAMRVSGHIVATHARAAVFECRGKSMTVVEACRRNQVRRAVVVFGTTEGVAGIGAGAFVGAAGPVVEVPGDPVV